MSRHIFSIQHAMIAMAGVFMIGCGGGGSSSTTASGKAYYIDAAVSGVTYRCGGLSGTTDSEGAFHFEVGKECSFKLGNIALRTLKATELAEGAVIIESNPKVAALLQSCDADGDPSNGIEIKQEVVDVLNQNGIVDVPDNEDDLEEVIADIKDKLPSLEITPVSYAEAEAHLQETYAKYIDIGKGHDIRLTDENAFNQYASGPVLYNIPVMGEELDYDQYGLAPLTDSEFNALSQDEKYEVALKLYGTFFYGADYEQFTEAVNSGRFISETRALFDRDNSKSDIAAIEEKLYDYSGGWGDHKLVAKMLGRIYFLEPGRAYLNRWAAYVLSQTILFSPAYELDTVYTVDAIDVYGDLVRDFDEGFSLQWVTFTHMMTDENWRRFRSPEDNGREMLEIYNMDFEDAHVPLAGKALQNWKLDRRSNTLVVTLDENVEPITDLFPGRVIRNGTDFYSTLVLQPSFVPTVTRRLVDIYFPNYTESQKQSVVNQIISSRPATWTGLLKQIVYSKAYLLNSNKTKSFEEAFFQIAKTLHWVPKKNSFYYIAKNLDKMHQSTMRYKLGRKVEVPLDSQSFAWFHKTIRDNIMINYTKDLSFESSDDGWPLKELFENMPQSLFSATEFDLNSRKIIDRDEWNANERLRAEYIVNHLFVPIAGREANSEELEFLVDLIDNSKDDDNRFDNNSWLDIYGNSKEVDDLKERGYFSQVVLSYLSRLSTIYEFEAVK
ncbi:hypothetical protein [Hydrogenimonas sp.]|uniref:hypothetical protein n=1 Tax=Hydrogenimonas sp. TaxID=2231112 RepID=UPI002637F075|nr:hypothetical protein [Hydrogenimonas sp.]